jgi:transcriptional regulator with XRE-family HTH domain
MCRLHHPCLVWAARVGLVAGWRDRVQRAGAGVTDDAGARRAGHRDRLAARRRALGLTQEELAAVLGVERSTVVRWEAGGTQPLPWLRPKLARALQVPAGRLAELLGEPAQAGPVERRPAAAPVPRQLPAAVADFTGRADELAALTQMLEQTGAGAPGTMVICAIGGTAGVGKTALALYWAPGCSPLMSSPMRKLCSCSPPGSATPGPPRSPTR